MTMPTDTSGIEIVTIEALDVFLNYYFLIHDHDSGRTALVDCGGAAPVLKALDERGWSLDEIWVTHHHWDHVDGIADLKAATQAVVKACPEKSPNMPTPDVILPLEGAMEFAGHEVQIMHVPGHAEGHIAFYIPTAQALFSGDSLLALGCGRLFEGIAEEMHTSLNRLATLPPETIVYSGHEYTQGNAQFALTVDPNNAVLVKRADEINKQREHGTPTVPSPLSLELATNPFLRTSDPAIRAALGLESASNLDVFADLRRRKDAF